VADIIRDIQDIKKELKVASKRPRPSDYSQPNFSANNRLEPPIDHSIAQDDISQTPQPEPIQKIPAPQKKEVKKEIPVKKMDKSKKQEREVDIALKDPTVKNFMDTFKAQIISVEQIKKTKK
jgi:hypothetical protein